MTGPSRRGRLVGVMRRTFQCLRADFFAFRFVSDFRPQQYIESIEQIFTDRSSETKWPSPPKRNALPKRAGKPPEGSRRNLRDTGAEKNVRNPGMASGKKTFARRDALRSCTRNSRTRSADQVRQIAASIRVSGFTGPVLFAGGNTIIAGAGPCAACAACAGRGNCATPGFIRTDVGMPVADHRIDMSRTGPPCNATAGKAGNDTMDSPALTGALSFPVRKTAGRFSLRFYAGMVRREASGARCEPATGDVRSAQAQLTPVGPLASTLAIPVPCPPTAGRFHAGPFHTGNRSPAGICGPAPCHRYGHRDGPAHR